MNSHGRKTVPLKKSRFSDLSHEDAIALLNKFEGPWLEIVLSQDSADICSGDVLGEVMLTLYSDPDFLALIPSNDPGTPMSEKPFISSVTLSAPMAMPSPMYPPGATMSLVRM